MFIAHIPAGYLVARGAQELTGRRAAGLLATGVAASILPDLDLAWFYLVDNRQHVHHDYLFHVPLFWVAVCAVVWLGGRALGWRSAGAYAGFAIAGLLLHLALDSVAADIRWLYPFSEQRFELTTVPDQGYNWWVLNFILHWTFALELAICAASGALFWQDKTRAGGVSSLLRTTG